MTRIPSIEHAFNLGAPEWLHGLWIGVVIMLVLSLSFYRSRRVLRRLAEPTMLERLTASVSWPRRWVKAVLLSLSAVVLAITLTQPQLGVESREVQRRGRDLVFVVDVSRSMLAQDLAPNRLERAKVWMKDLVNALEGDRAGVVAFAGAPVVRSPLTMDRDFLSLAIDELSPDTAPRGGTLIGDAIRKTVSQVFDLEADEGEPDARSPYRDIILITDGEDQDSFPVEAARAAGDLGVRIIAIGIGGSETPVPAREEDAGRYQTSGGQVVRSSLNAEALAEIAAASDAGVFLNVGDGSIALDAVYRDLIASAEQTNQGAAEVTKYTDRFVWALIPAIALLVLESLIGQRRRTR